MIRRVTATVLLAALTTFVVWPGNWNLPDSSNSVFAEAIVSARIRACGHVPIERLEVILGPPPETYGLGQHSPNCVFITTRHVCVNYDGEIVVRMAAPFRNGPNIDIRVYDNAMPEENRLSVSVSRDLIEWHPLGTKRRPQHQWYFAFDLGDLEGPFVYIRLRGEGQTGPAIVAIEALYPIEE